MSLEKFKIDFIEKFITENNICSVMELNVLDKIILHTNHDISIYNRKFISHGIFDDIDGLYELTFSINIPFQLVSEYNNPIMKLFKTSFRYVIIYSFDKSIDIIKNKLSISEIEDRYEDFNLINKFRDDKLFSSSFYIFERKQKIILSLTSYDLRIKYTHIVIESLKNQTMKGDIILWLPYGCQITEELDKILIENNRLQNDKNFKINDDNIDSEYHNCNNNYEIKCYYYHDIKSYKKLIPSLKKFPKDIIITFDDDFIYDPNIVDYLYKSYLSDKNSVHAVRCHVPSEHENNKFFKYNSWKRKVKEQHNNLFFTSGGGTLFPPNSIHKDVFDEKIFMSLCPTTDDIWFNFMVRLNGTKIKLVEKIILNSTIEEVQQSALFNYNKKGGNNLSLSKIYDYFIKKYGFDIIKIKFIES